MCVSDWNWFAYKSPWIYGYSQRITHHTNKKKKKRNLRRLPRKNRRFWFQQKIMDSHNVKFTWKGSGHNLSQIKRERQNSQCCDIIRFLRTAHSHYNVAHLANRSVHTSKSSHSSELWTTYEWERNYQMDLRIILSDGWFFYCMIFVVCVVDSSCDQKPICYGDEQLFKEESWSKKRERKKVTCYALVIPFNLWNYGREKSNHIRHA